jgi:TP901 family phage tail tape measure protein
LSMSKTLRVALEFTGNAAGVKRTLNEVKGSVFRWSHAVKGEFRGLAASVGSLQGTIASLGLSVGAVALAAESARLDKSMTQIGQTAGASSAKVEALRTDLFRMGRQTGQSVDQLKEGFDALVQSGLSMEEAKQTLEGINVAMAVTGAQAQILSSGLTVAATAFQFNLAKPGQALALLDRMTVAGRLGNAELQNLSDIFARVGVNAKSAGLNFDKTLALIETLSMVERQPERLGTLVDSTLRLFTNVKYMEKAQKATGVRFFDKKGARRDVLDILEDLKKKFKKLKTEQKQSSFIGEAFGEMDTETRKGLMTLFGGDMLSKARGFTREINEAGGTLERDLPQAVANAVDQTGRLKNALREAADSFARPINDAVQKLIQYGLNKKTEGGLELSGGEIIGGSAAAVLGAALAMRYGTKAIGSVAGKLLKSGGATALGVAEGKVVEAVTGVAPVFVTNWPDGGIGGGIAGKAPLPVTAGGTSALAQLGLAGAAGAGVAGFALGAREIGQWLGRRELNLWSEEKLGTIRAQQMVMGGGPDSFQIKAIDEELRRRATIDTGPIETVLQQENEKLARAIKDIKNEIRLNIRIDQAGRVTTTTNDLNTTTEINLNRGGF